MNKFWSTIRHCCSESRLHFTATGEELYLRIDDRNQQDTYDGFCDVRAIVPNTEGESFTLELQQPPVTAEVRDYVEAHGGQIREAPAVTSITFHLKVVSGAQVISGLAKVIRRVTRRGQQYADQNWKWICPRTAKTLERFASTLTTVRQRQNEKAMRCSTF
jgi:hypothetical protein